MSYEPKQATGLSFIITHSFTNTFFNIQQAIVNLLFKVVILNTFSMIPIFLGNLQGSVQEPSKVNEMRTVGK